jgi:hypothetical protein
LVRERHGIDLDIETRLIGFRTTSAQHSQAEVET